MSEDNKALVRRSLDMFSTGDFSALEEIVAADYVGYDPGLPEPLRGPEGFQAQVEGYRGGFSGLKLTVEQQLAEGDYVVSRWSGGGTHDGDLMGIAPTGRSVSSTGITISRVADGKIVEERTEWNSLGLMTQLGVVPAMA